MTHLLVTQLRFARHEFRRCLDGTSPVDGCTRVLPMNSLSWIIGHLASQENIYWVYLGQEKTIFPELHELVGYGKPASTPPFEEMWNTWQAITMQADIFLDSMTGAQLLDYFESQGKPVSENIGTMLYRNIYHYWFHLGEAHAIRQSLGHVHLPDFVGDMSNATYQTG